MSRGSCVDCSVNWSERQGEKMFRIVQLEGLTVAISRASRIETVTWLGRVRRSVGCMAGLGAQLRSGVS